MNIFSILKKNKIDMDSSELFHYSILDKLGQTILESNSRNVQQKIHLNPGLYHIEINYEKGVYQQKIII